MIPGRYDQFRNKKNMPEGVDFDAWNAFLDEQNKKDPPALAHHPLDQVDIQKFLKASQGWVKEYKANPKTTGPSAPVKEVQDAGRALIDSRNKMLEGRGRAGLVTSQAYHNAAREGRKIGDEASAKEQAALDQLIGQYADLDKKDQNALADYLEKTDPYMAEIIAKGENPEDVQRQLEAYNTQKQAVDKYKELSDPTVTAKERYMSELARREFESKDLSNRQAVSEQMANRGLRSGGQEIAANQSSQMQLAQDRLLKELGIQGQAVDRSMKALEGWSTGANQLGLAAGAIREADQSERKFQAEFRNKEAERIAGLAGERKTASDTTTGRLGTRAQDIYGKTGETAEKQYQHGQNAISGDIAASDFDYQNTTDYANASNTTGQANLDTLTGILGLGVNEKENQKEQDIVGVK